MAFFKVNVSALFLSKNYPLSLLGGNIFDPLFLILLIQSCVTNHCYRESVDLNSLSATFTQSIEPYMHVVYRTAFVTLSELFSQKQVEKD